MKHSIPDTSFQVNFIHIPDTTLLTFLSADPQKKSTALAPVAVLFWQNSGTTGDVCQP